MKIAIIGYSGCGKSTLADYLKEKYHIPVLYLDCIHWLPGWEERSQAEEKMLVKQFLDQNTSWVIDGNYANLCYQRRLEEADRIIYMNFNRFTCLCRAVKRYVRYRGKTRESMTEDCPEKLDLEFIWWILYAGRTREYKKRYRNVLKRYASKTIVIKNQRQLTAFTNNNSSNSRKMCLKQRRNHE